MNHYHLPEPAPAQQAHQIAEPLIRDGCLVNLPMSPDISITQGSDFRLKICLQGQPPERILLRCIAPTSVTLPAAACVKVGDTLALICGEGCDFMDGAQHKITAISADGLVLTVDPPIAGLAAERCYADNPLPLIGCIAPEPQPDPPSVLVLGDRWTLHGVLAYQVTDGLIRQFGVMSQAGSRYLRTAALGITRRGDHITVQGAGIIDAEVLNITAVQDPDTGTELEVIEVSQPATSTGCFAAFAADGLLLTFSIEADGVCQTAVLPASQTKLLRPRPGDQVPSGCDPQTFLGYYALFGTTVTMVDGKPVQEVFEVMSGCALLKLTAAANVRLQTVKP